MEFRELLGRRRSIRFVDPDRPVEQEKVQRMFEASRLASHWGNVQSLRAVAVFKDSAPAHVIDAVKAVIVGWQIQIAPVVIVWYLDPNAVDDQGDRLRELLDAGALGFGPKEGRVKALEEVLLPIFAAIGDTLKEPGLNEVDCGQGIAQATLMAFEQGLGTCCLGTPHGEAIKAAVGIPSQCRVLLLQTVGYPLESWEAGGQRPRLPFGELYKMNTFDNPYPRSEAVVQELTKDKTFTRPAPLPDRDEELAELQEKLGIEPPGLL